MEAMANHWFLALVFGLAVAVIWLEGRRRRFYRDYMARRGHHFWDGLR